MDDRGVVDENIDTAELVFCSAGHAFDIGLNPHVGNNGKRLAAEPTNRIRYVLDLAGRARCCHDVSAGLTECECNGPADAFAGTGHKCGSS